MNQEEKFISKYEFQVNKPNGDIDFIEVFDLPYNLSLKFVKKKYPDCEILDIVGYD